MKREAPGPLSEPGTRTAIQTDSDSLGDAGPLTVPDLPPDVDTLSAALAYAKCGFYVLPVRRTDPKNPGKNPGSVVGNDWTAKSSRDPKVIAAWFAGTDHNIALHLGRSGAVAFDVDDPDKVPDALATACAAAPYQSSRPDTPGRGHYVFRQPPGRTLGNGTGRLAGGWGEVRGHNGVVIVAPSWHPEGGEYRWQWVGPVPVLPAGVAADLDDASPADDAATDAQIAAFLTSCVGDSRPGALAGLVKALERKYTAGESRHHSTVTALAGACKEAAAGLYPATAAVEAIKALFLAAVARDPMPGGKQGAPRVGPVAESEWRGMLAWAVGQALAADLDAVRARVDDKLPDNWAWLNRVGANGQQEASAGEPEEPTAEDTVPALKSPALKFSDGHRPTDVGNAARLLQVAGHRLRYVHAWGKWLVYRRGRWIIDEKDALVTEIAKQVAKGLFELAAKTAENEPNGVAKAVWAWALKSGTSGAIAAMIRLARGAPGILVDHEDLDADPWLLNVANGTIDLRTGQLRPHDPADLCTLQAPVAYDPDATAPLWEECLRRWQPDDDIREYLQTRAGASATGEPTETVDIDYGGGGNGKSRFHGAIQHVLGPYTAVPHKSLLVAGRSNNTPTVVADLFRKRLAVASETKHAEALDDESVKNLTGGDRLKGRRMREDSWEFWPTHTLIMFSNHKPSVAGRDEGIWRRLRLVPWAVTIPEAERDEGLAAKLRAEAPGILAWIVAGAVRFNSAGLRPPAVVRVATDQYRKDEDVIGRFIAETLEFSPALRCFSSDLKRELDAWCAEQGIETPPRMNEIAATLRERGCEVAGRKSIRGQRSTLWRGVAVTQKEDETP